MTAMISTEAELEENLSRPTPEVVTDMARLKGDLIILGVGGKMGPTLARMARRAMDEAKVKHAVVGVARFTDPRSRQTLEEAGVRAAFLNAIDAARHRSAELAQGGDEDED